MKKLMIVAAILAFRLLNAVTLATFFQPDEYFQAFEPAHVRVFGYGFLTWEWKFGLRGCLVPMVYSYFFQLADKLDVDLVLVCRIFQGVIAAIGDVYTYKLARRLETRKVAKYALFTSLGSSFYYYCGTRPFANTFEMVFTTVALAYWPWQFEGYAQFLASSFLAHFAIILRPTNATLWLFLGMILLWKTPDHRFGIAALSAVLAFLVHGADFLLDNWFYGFDVWPLRSFVLTNIGDKVSHYYGVMPIHFYVTSAVPMMLIGYLPITVYGMLKQKNMWSLIVFSQIAIYSMLAHKEIRFIFYLLPILHIIFARTILHLGMRKWMILFVSINALAGGYLSYVHQRGVMSVTAYIRQSNISEVTFLMPCHSIPGYAHFHRDAPLDIGVLGCDPPVTVPLEQRSTYIDEADQFYADPVGFLESHPEKLTKHITVFEALLPLISPVLDNYHEVARFFNSHIHEDSRRKGDVIVYERNS